VGWIAACDIRSLETTTDHKRSVTSVCGSGLSFTRTADSTGTTPRSVTVVHHGRMFGLGHGQSVGLGLILGGLEVVAW
jgi:hypothetical protein